MSAVRAMTNAMTATTGGVLGQGDDAGGGHGQQAEDGEDEAKGESAAGWRRAADAGRRVVVVVGRVPGRAIRHARKHSRHIRCG